MLEIIIGILVIIIAIFGIRMVIRKMRERNAAKEVPQIDQETLEAKFKNMATEILDNNAAKFKETATEPMRNMMLGLQDEIRRLQEQSAENTTLVKALEMNTSKLGSILSNTKMRGDFGELIIEKWFDIAGLQKGVHYETQVVMPNNSRPDFVMYMPDRRCIIMDSKVPLDQLAGAFDDTVGKKQQAVMFKEHRAAVRGHITKLGKQKYSTCNVPGAGEAAEEYQPVEYVIMIVPEYALNPIMDTDMINFAQKRGIILATPSMIVLVANVVHMMWKQRNISQNVRQVINKAATLQRVIDDFSKQYDTIGTAINTLSNRYNKGEKIFEERVVPVSAELVMASDVATEELAEMREKNVVDKNDNSMMDDHTANDDDVNDLDYNDVNDLDYNDDDDDDNDSVNADK